MFGDHAVFIVPAYAISIIVLVFMVVRLRWQYAARQNELAQLDKSGIRRRAENSANNKDPQ